MSDSLILRTAVRFLVPLLGLLSLFFLLRGHNEPGGGFIGGLVAAGAVALAASGRIQSPVVAAEDSRAPGPLDPDEIPV